MTQLLECGSSRGVDMFDLFPSQPEEVEEETATFTGVSGDLKWSCIPVGTDSQDQLLEEFMRKHMGRGAKKMQRRLKFYGHTYATTENGILTSNGVKDLLDACHMWISSLSTLKAQRDRSSVIVEETMRLLIHVEVAARNAAFSEGAEFELISMAVIEIMKRVHSIQSVAVATSGEDLRENYRLHAVLFVWFKAYSILTIINENRSHSDGQFSRETVLPIFGSMMMCGLLRISHLFGKTHPVPCECVRQAWTTLFFDSGANFWELFCLPLSETYRERNLDSDDDEFLLTELDAMNDAENRVPVATYIDVALVLIGDITAESKVENDFIVAHEALASLLRKSEISSLSRFFYSIVKLFSSLPQNLVGGNAYLGLLKKSISDVVRDASSPISGLPDLASDRGILDLVDDIRSLALNDATMPATLAEPSHAWKLRVNVKMFMLICSEVEIWRRNKADLWTFFKQLMEALMSEEQRNSALLVLLCLFEEKREISKFTDDFVEYLGTLFTHADPKRLLNTCCVLSRLLSSSKPLEALTKYSYKVKALLGSSHFTIFVEQKFSMFFNQCFEAWMKNSQRLNSEMARYLGFCVANLPEGEQKKAMESVKIEARKERNPVRIEFVTAFVVQFLASASATFDPTLLGSLWFGVAMTQGRRPEVAQESIKFCKRLQDWWLDRNFDDVPFVPRESTDPNAFIIFYMEALISAEFNDTSIRFQDWFGHEVINAWKESFSVAARIKDLESQQSLLTSSRLFFHNMGERIYSQCREARENNIKSIVGQFLLATKTGIEAYQGNDRVHLIAQMIEEVLRIDFIEEPYVNSVISLLEAMGESPRVPEILASCSRTQQGERVLREIKRSGRVPYHTKVTK
ncbi:hypothetical protein L596_029094 [Steinernema carpocapsae]|uniref:Uncharacterized protein n=1 Tax=Steinernema carpocapsae TaxID=34508 RepID=A0A4U5LTM0_STECR|nr:hypothetical protein L596_029094 [Steinernema carpocapsae]